MESIIEADVVHSNYKPFERDQHSDELDSVRPPPKALADKIELAL